MVGKITDEMRAKWKQQVSFLEEKQNSLNDWELGFLDSISGKDLSLKQSFKLGEIYRRIRDA